LILSLLNKMRNLDKIFNPKSVAIVGATSREKSVGLGLVKNILLGQDQRKIFFVNPNQPEILGIKTFAKITDINLEVDLAVVAVPAKIVPEIINDCCTKKVGGIIVISAGFGETGKEGSDAQVGIVEKVRDAGIPMIGPNCLGVVNVKESLNASFAPGMPKEGNVSFISQSGAVLDVIIDGAENLGISSAISFGNEADVTLVDLLEWAEKDEDTKVISLYVEAIKDGREFMKVAKRIISGGKPIVAIKAGKFESASNAVKSHTGSMAGDYQIYKATFKQVGVVEAESIEDLIDISRALSWQPRCKNSFAIITNGGGYGVMASDCCKNLGVNLAKLSKETVDRISNSQFMSSVWSKGNPIDVVGDASPERYGSATEAALSQKNIAGLMIIQTPQIMTDSLGNAMAIVEAKKQFPEKPIVCFFLGRGMSGKAIEFLEEHKIPNYPGLKNGIIAVKSLIKQ